MAATCCVAVWHLRIVDKLRHGYLPVEFFFALSGVWLYNTYLKHQDNGYTAFQYTWNRMKRIYPSYLIACCTFFALNWEKFQSADGWLKALSELLLLREGGGPYSGGIAYTAWYLSAMLIGGYFVYAFLERYGSTMVRLICPVVIFGTYSYIFSLGESIEYWGSVGPFSIPLMRGIAGLCLGVCLREAASYVEKHNSTVAYNAVNVLSILSLFGIVVCLLSQEYLDRYCLIFFSAILLACFLEHSWLNQAIQGMIWQRLGKYTLEMYMIHISVIVVWRKLPWKPYGPIEKSLYIAAYLIAVFVAGVVLNKLGAVLRKGIREGTIKKNGKWVLCMAMVACFAWIACHQRIRSDIDNYFIAMITNGLYSKNDVYAQYLHPLLCKGIFTFHKFFPQADCFSLLLRIALVGAGGWMGYLLAKRARNLWAAVGGCILFLILALTGRIFEANYTITAAFFAAIGLFSICVAIEAETGNASMIAGGTIFLVFGVMLRKESGMLALPFLFMFVIIRFVDGFKLQVKGRGKEILKVAVVPCLVIGVLLLTNTLFYRSPKRGQDALYNTSRTSLVDYPVKPWEEIRDQLPQISENDYACIRSWIFADTEYMDEGFMYDVAAQAAEKPQLTIETLAQANQTVWKTLCTSQTMVFSIWIPVLFVALFIMPRKQYEILEAMLAVAGSYIIMLILALKGRFPERVCIAACLPVLSLLGANLLQATKRPGAAKPTIIATMVVGILLAALPISKQINLQKDLCLSLIANTPGDESIYEYTGPDDAIYLCNSHDMWVPGNGKLPTAAYMSHYVSWGDWTYGQTYHREFLNNLGIPNPMQALLTREHTYLLCHDNTLVFRYLQEHYDANVAVVQVGTINGEEVWEFSIPQ